MSRRSAAEQTAFGPMVIAACEIERCVRAERS
jgi:hypothetical protein